VGNNHKIDYYTFSERCPTTLRPRAVGRGQATLFRKALEYVRSRYEGRDLAGIVLISDGAATGSFDEDSGDGAVRDFLRSLDTRVHTVWARAKGSDRGRESWPTVRVVRRSDRRRDPHDGLRAGRCRSRAPRTATPCAKLVDLPAGEESP
jgi:hypothetical protein